MNTTKERLYIFLKFKNLKAAAFERACGLSNGFCSKVNSSITEGSIRLIQNAFPELNIDWLRTGEGEMIVKPQETNNISAMMTMMQQMLSLGRTNADANLLNAEANKLNAKNLDRLISILEQKTFLPE